MTKFNMVKKVGYGDILDSVSIACIQGDLGRQLVGFRA